MPPPVPPFAIVFRSRLLVRHPTFAVAFTALPLADVFAAVRVEEGARSATWDVVPPFAFVRRLVVEDLHAEPMAFAHLPFPNVRFRLLEEATLPMAEAFLEPALVFVTRHPDESPLTVKQAVLPVPCRQVSRRCPYRRGRMLWVTPS